MTTWFDSMFRISAQFAESGMLMMDSAMQTMQSAIGRLTGVAPAEPPVQPPLHGPVTLDEAIADLCNRLVRIGWTTPLRPEYAAELGRELMFSLQQSFAGLDLSDPRQWLTLPLQLPLSLGTLATRMSLRMLYAADVVGPDKVPGFDVVHARFVYRHPCHGQSPVQGTDWHGTRGSWKAIPMIMPSG